VFGSGGSTGAITPTVDVKSLHAKIGELTLENDFLEGALSKADGKEKTSSTPTSAKFLLTCFSGSLSRRRLWPTKRSAGSADAITSKLLLATRLLADLLSRRLIHQKIVPFGPGLDRGGQPTGLSASAPTIFSLSPGAFPSMQTERLSRRVM
jgi:hypothetical protein